MKILLVLDQKNYTEQMKVTERYCVRAIIWKNGKFAVQKSTAGDCKLIGGGMERCEDVAEALDREVQEEAGLVICRDSIAEVGEILEKRKDIYDPHYVYICHTWFYICEVQEEQVPIHMTASELAKGFHLEWVTPAEFVRANTMFMHQPWTYRDTQFVKNFLA